MVTSYWPLAHPALYLRWRSVPTAVPTYISGRTSYLWVRLEFLRYPQVIPHFCNSGGFGPRRGFTPASPCSWVDHPVSGRIHATRARPVQTRFRCGSTPLAGLNLAASMHSPDHSTKGTPSGSPGCEQLGHRPLTVGGYRVSGLFDSPCRGAFHLSLTVLVHYRSSRVFSLGGWSPLLPTGLLGSRGTQARGGSPSRVRLPGSHRLRLAFPGHSSPRRGPHVPGLQPQSVPKHAWFGLFRVRSPLLTESRLISLPRGTEMFQFPRFPSQRYGFTLGYAGMACVGCPIRTRTAHRLVAAPRARFGAIPVLHRPVTPRHPPCTLYSLAYLARSSWRRSPAWMTGARTPRASATSKVLVSCGLPRAQCPGGDRSPFG